MFSYDTSQGEVTHFYGLKPAFGGIWAIKGIDFEKIGGFPNYWAWGFEDNKIRSKWIKSGGKINYDQFVEYTDSRIVKLDCSNYGHDTRIVNKHNLWYAQNENYISGYHTIRDLKYDVKDIEINAKMINVSNFFTEKKESSQAFVKNVNQKQITVDYQRRVEREKKKVVKKARADASKPGTWRGRGWRGLGLVKKQRVVDKKKVVRRKKINLNLLNRRR